MFHSLLHFCLRFFVVLSLVVCASSQVFAEAAGAAKAEKSSESGSEKQAAAAYVFDAAQSEVKWKGDKVIGSSHEGLISVKSGEIIWNQTPQAATVVVDMRTIKNTDITQAGSKKKLEAHLKNEDFFHVTEYPLATLKAKSFKATGKADTYDVTGDITIRGVTKPITYQAVLKQEGSSIKGSGTITLDRTEFNVKYNSKKFFPDLGDKIIKDDFILSYSFQAQKKAAAQQ